MKAVYSVLFFSVVLPSCGFNVGYLGNSEAPTQKVDVYVDAAAVPRRYKIIGKGYVESLVKASYPVRKLQAKAIEQAKRNGADAVLFQDYFVQQNASSVQSTTHTDTAGRGVVVARNGSVMPVVASGQQILFLKYQ